MSTLQGKKTYIAAGISIALGLGSMFFPDIVNAAIPDVNPSQLIMDGILFITTRLGIAAATSE